MKVLLDTHALLWWLDGDRKLSRRARAAISDEATTVFVSAASAWELSTKVRLGKLPGATEVAAELSTILASQNFEPLAVTVEHALRAGSLAGDHRDPVDRMLIAQAQCEDLLLATNEALFERYGVRRLW